MIGLLIQSNINKIMQYLYWNERKFTVDFTVITLKHSQVPASLELNDRISKSEFYVIDLQLFIKKNICIFHSLIVM